ITPLIPGAGPPPTSIARLPRGCSDMIHPVLGVAAGRHWPAAGKHERSRRQFQVKRETQKECRAADDYSRKRPKYGYREVWGTLKVSVLSYTHTPLNRS